MIVAVTYTDIMWVFAGLFRRVDGQLRHDEPQVLDGRVLRQQSVDRITQDVLTHTHTHTHTDTERERERERCVCVCVAACSQMEGTNPFAKLLLNVHCKCK